jgi:tetratricopeptide (TPR) repeat protein
VLSEEALIVAAVVGACSLLVLGILELVWPTRRRRGRRSEVEPPPARPSPSVTPARPTQSILPRRLIDSPSAARPTGFVFPPPADYVPPPLPREEMRPLRPVGYVVPDREADPEPPQPLPATEPSEPVEEPAVPPEPAYIPPPALDIEPEPIVPLPIREETEPVTIEPESRPLEREPRVFGAGPPYLEPAPTPIEPEPIPIEPAPTPVEPAPWFVPEPAHREHESPRSEPESPRFEHAPAPLEPEPPRVEPDAPRAEPEVPRFEIEPVPADLPEPPAPELEMPFYLQEPSSADAAPPSVDTPIEPIEPTPAVVDAEPAPIEPASPIGTPELQPVVLAPPSFEPIAPPPERVEPPEPAPDPEPPLRRRRSKISPHARPHRVLRPAPQEPTVEPPVSGVTLPTPTDAAASAPLSLPGASARRDAILRRDTPLVERCFALYQERRFDEVLSVGEPALDEMKREPSAGSARETAALWSVVGLAKQALGDHDGAHAALESSIEAASEPERSTYRRHLASLALEAAQARLARAGSHDTGDRMAVIRTAIAWTERGLAVVPADAALSDTRESSHEALWQAYEQAATALLQRQEFPAARRIFQEALNDSELPAARAAAFRGLMSGTFGGEIGQLTAQAILGMQEGRESEAIGALQRAEELLQTIPADALPQTRRDEVDQRLWWGWAELGSRRLDAGDYEEALDPLIHALRFTSIGPERQAETRAAVVRALEGIAAVRALSIRRLAEAGSRDEAIVAAGDLHGLVKRGLEMGLTEDDLMAAFARVRRLCEELGMDTRA